MSKPASRLGRFFYAIEKRGYGAWTPIGVAAWIAGLRITEEHLFIYIPKGLRRDHIIWYGHITLFYLALILSIAALLRHVAKRPTEKAIPAAAAGMIFGILPPLIDAPVYGLGGFNYGYRLTFFRDFPPLLYDPPLITPLGETITVWASLLLIMLYVKTMGASWPRTLLVGLGHYGLILLYLVIVPSTALYLQSAFKGVSGNEATAILLTLMIFTAYFLLHPRQGLHLLKRMPHPLLAPSLVFLGSGLVGRINGHTFVAAFALWLAACLFTLHNNHYDHQEDGFQGRERLVQSTHVAMLMSLPLGLWLVFAVGHFWVVLAAMLFLVVGYAYHGDPMRLKCVFPLSYKSESFFALISLLAGVLCHGRILLSPIQGLMLLLIAGGFSLGAMFKDFKDIPGDTHAKAQTFYVVMIRKGWSEAKTHRVVLALLGICLGVPTLYALTVAPWIGGTLAGICAGIFALLHFIKNRKLATVFALIGINAYLWTCTWLAMEVFSTPA